jgi:hypothetical protein
VISEVKRTFENGVLRILSYDDVDDVLVERIVHDDALYQDTFADNQEMAANYRPHQNAKTSNRKVASVPVDIYLKWLHEAGVDGYLDKEAADMVVKKKLLDPENRDFLTVPTSYRIKTNV